MDNERLEEEKELALDIINDNIKRLKDKEGISWKELGKRAAMTRQQLSNIMYRRCLPTVRTLIKVAYVFDITVCYLLTDHRNENDKYKLTY